MSEYEYVMEPDYKELVIRFGEWEFDCTSVPKYHLSGAIHDKVTEVLRSNGVDNLTVPLEDCRSKVLFQTFTEKFKIKPRTFVDMVNKLQYKVLVRGLNKSVLHSVCYSGPHKRHLNIPCNFKEIKPVLVQCVEDGIPNVTPLVATTGKSPKELKEFLGKGLWKKYCKRSLTANTIVSNRSIIGGDKGHWAGLYNTPITFLKYTNCRHSVHIGRLVKEAKVSSNIPESKKIAHLVNDTISMSLRLDQLYNKNWSLNRIKEEHDRLSILQLEGNFSSDKFTSPTYKGLPEAFDCVEGKAKLLLSEVEVAREGRVMRHCVGSYASWCTKGEYAVYHITDSDGNESTLGLITYGEGQDLKWVFDQHYSYCNDGVSQEAESVCKGLMKFVKSVKQEGE